MWSPSLRAPPLWAGACFLSFVSAFCLPPRRRRYAPSPVGGCVLPLLFRGCRLRRRCPFSLVRPSLRGGAPRCACGLYRFPTPPFAPSDAPLWRRGRPNLSPSQSREPQVSAFAPCERREVYGLPKHCFELNAPLGGAGFPVLECPSLFAPLALTRCGRLARRVFPGCKEAFSASDRNTNRINIFLNLRRLSRSSR